MYVTGDDFSIHVDDASDNFAAELDDLFDTFKPQRRTRIHSAGRSTFFLCDEDIDICDLIIIDVAGPESLPHHVFYCSLGGATNFRRSDIA